MKKNRFHFQSRKIAKLFRNLGKPARLRILMTIGVGEACVCHLEAMLGYRQAYISQHLMELRKEGYLDTRREGRYIYYSLCEPGMLSLIRKAGELAEISKAEIEALIERDNTAHCPCPKCTQNRSSETLIEPDELTIMPKVSSY